MLDALRRGANSWLLKPLMLILVLAFVAWGVADVFTHFGDNSLASVGSASITPEEFQRTYGMVMDNIARRFGRRPSAEEAHLRGVDRAVLEDMINSASIDQFAADLGLALPQRTIVAAIEKDPTFQGPDGRFSKPMFDAFLRETGYSERGWLTNRRREEVRQQIVRSMFDSVPVPSELVNLVNQYREEKRTVQYFTMQPDKVVKLGDPDEAKLRETYDANKGQFVTREYRHLAVLMLSVDDIKKSLVIPDEEIRKAYDADKAGQVIPERRHIQQISFKDKAAAEAAASEIAKGESFMDVAKETGASESDVDLGTTTKAQMLDPKIADAAFALAKDKLSAPVEGRFATVLLRVTEITPGKTRTFDEMKQEIRDRLATQKASEEIRQRRDAVDDGRSAGRPLKDIAATVGAKYVDIPETDSLGRTMDGKPAYEGSDGAAILQAGFEGKVGVESEAVDLADGGSAWVDVLGTTPSRQRPFEEVKDEVRKLWADNETARQMNEAAAKIIERAKAGETLTKLASETGGKLETTIPFRRFGDQPAIPPAALARAFTLPLGGLGSTEAGEGKGRIVMKVVEIKKPDPAAKEAASQITEQLRAGQQQDAIQAFVTALRERTDARINEAEFARVVGAGDASR